jgi:hypothetical protein
MGNNIVQEIAISLNFRIYSDRPNVIINQRTKKEYTKNDIETAILVYEDRVKGWFLRYGHILQEHHDAAFVVLQIAVAQIEGIEQYQRGESSENKSKEFFSEGLKKIFDLTTADDLWINDFYVCCRCGIFHDGMTRKRVLIENRRHRPLEYKDNQIWVSPNKFLDTVSAYFSTYVEELKEPTNTDLRLNFEKMWNY